MLTDNEKRLFDCVLRLVSVLTVIQIGEERGHTAISLPTTLAVTRQYLMERCPALLDFVERCYRQQPIPEGLSALAEQQAVSGRILPS